MVCLPRSCCGLPDCFILSLHCALFLQLLRGFYFVCQFLPNSLKSTFFFPITKLLFSGVWISGPGETVLGFWLLLCHFLSSQSSLIRLHSDSVSGATFLSSAGSLGSPMPAGAQSAVRVCVIRTPCTCAFRHPPVVPSPWVLSPDRRGSLQ